MFTDFENDSKSIQTVCIYLVVSIILIVLFVISPLKKMPWVSTIGKFACIALLTYTLYENFIMTYDEENKANKICGYILSLFILVLILSIVRKFFITNTNSPVPLVI
jgi:hypothetical protein